MNYVGRVRMLVQVKRSGDRTVFSVYSIGFCVFLCRAR